MSAFYVKIIPTKVSYRNFHILHSLVHNFFLGRVFLHQTEHSSIPCQFVQDLASHFDFVQDTVSCTSFLGVCHGYY